MATLHDREWTIIDDVKSEKVLKEIVRKNGQFRHNVGFTKQKILKW